jgi:hypothetical protein
MQYEFRGKTLQHAVRNAIRPQTLHHKGDAGESATCQQLFRWKTELSVEATGLESDVDRIEDAIKDLERSRSEDLTDAAISGAIVAAGALASVLRGVRTLSRTLRRRRAGLEYALALVPGIGMGLETARHALSAINSTREIRQLTRELEDVQRRYNALNVQLSELNREYQYNNCEVVLG